MYPDQGKLINIFSTTPRLALVEAAYRSPYSAGFYFTLCSSTPLNRLTNELLYVFQGAIHDVPFLFPYERVEIDFHGPYRSVEQYLTIQLYVSAFTLSLKHLH